uniref:Uncharacterized protein n=1 Tax=Arundo donax TaxID=35708 RepID=A0A0A9BWW2_ARUDO
MLNPLTKIYDFSLYLGKILLIARFYCLSWLKDSRGCSYHLHLTNIQFFK